MASVWQYVIGALILVISIIIILGVLLQQGRRQGINGAISGGADTFLSKNKARTVDAVLERVTKYFALIFFILALAANAATIIFKK